MTIYNDLKIRLQKFAPDERSEFTDIFIVALQAADNLLLSLVDLQEDIALFKEMQTPERVLEVNKSWEDFAYKAKNTAEMLEKENLRLKIHDKG